jgi:uncharacterized protein
VEQPRPVEVAVPPSLRFLLPLRDRAAGTRRLRWEPDATVGHVVQSAGVPLTEVGGLALDDAPVRPGARPRPGSRIAVADVVRPEPEPAGGFLLDVGLGSLARRLRLLGIDAAWSNDADDPALVDRSNAEDRVLLTQDRGLLRRRALLRGALVRGIGGDDQLADVLDRFRPALAPLTRCTACGGSLEPTGRDAVAHRLEPGTLRSHDRFARCVECDHVYWHGAHGRRIDALVRSALGR